MIGWLSFFAALFLFFATHFLPARGGLREALIARLGRRGYFALYGGLSVALLAWLVAAAARAPYVELWPNLPWQRWAPTLVMPVALFLVVAGIRLPYPYTLGGRRDRPFNPLYPGFAAVTRHPLLWALALWSGAHLLPNGDLAHVILFGSFLGLSLAGMRVFDARARRAMSPDDARIAFRATELLSPLPLFSAIWRENNESALSVRLVIAIILWAVILWWHQTVIGVSPLPL
ncbi:NnrU family protein [Cereibacter changlensis JA139]|uniref:NnrU family protein n=2 Tax=Cereibacter changlensis TaxID=402884 RepID=A0A2T4JVN5_9RHOB|nr:NnrU family protein [Cereibacter changlensis]PTE21982.1 NnrU family protein [Cereibacter changlensis JA139]PZX54470.1 putative membrane protein [Cereibacter changlensis]